MKELEVRSQGIPRYINELYNNSKKFELQYGLHVEKLYPKRYYKKLGDALSFELDTIINRRNWEKYDIIHLPNGSFRPHKIPKDKKYVVTIHDVNPIPAKTNNILYLIEDRIWSTVALRRGIVYNARIADRVIVNSTQTRDEVIALGKEKRYVDVVNLGIDKRFMINNKKHHLSNKYIVGYIGSFATNKNVRFVIEASKLIDKSFKFDIWGAKTYDYANLVSMASLDKKIKFRGFVPEEQLVNVYDSFDVFVFPSLYEGFGLPIIEAQARGLPVIIYKYGKIPKEVRKYCFEAESPEHMAQIIENLKENGYNEKLRKKATEYARSFTWEKTAKETLEVYKKVTK
ncbi:MAG: glycosyltransferase [Candidatus Micrarchaeaceae archaeon]